MALAFSKDDLTSEQLHILDRVLLDVHKKDKTNPLVLYVGGAGGTGKTVVINCIVEQVGIAHVIVCGSTAMAGRNINGNTIHSILKLNPFSEAQDDIPLPPHPHLLLLIIDEISMCDSKLLKRIEKRLRQLMQNDLPFGGCTVVFFGDLLQIPPVSKNDKNGFPLPPDWIFKSPLWQKFVQYEELETIMRQERDPEFGKMLSRWRIGSYTQQDRDFLNSLAEKFLQRCPTQEFCQQYDNRKASMILAYTNEMIGKLNKKITYKFFNESQLFNISKSHHSYNGKEKSLDTKHTLMFKVGVGSRVMIGRNIDSRLVNGEICSVLRIKALENQVISMDLRLSSDHGTRADFTPVKDSITKEFDSETWTTSYPIHPAYAVTYHKAQGQTLDSVFLVTEKVLPPALFYVGASRVRSREGLHILNFNAADSIRADPEAIEEYKRLRMSVGKSPLPL